MAALFEREQSGLGQHVETSLAQAFTVLDTWGWFEQFIAQRKWPDAYVRVASYDEDEIPTTPFAFYLLIALTKDGHRLQFAQYRATPVDRADARARAGVDAHRPELGRHPGLRRSERRLQLWEEMLEAAGTKTLAEWQAIFDVDPNVFAEIFRPGPEVLDHPADPVGRDGRRATTRSVAWSASRVRSPRSANAGRRDATAPTLGAAAAFPRSTSSRRRPLPAPATRRAPSAGRA